jgi:MOSC domain-containing protein YiiM
MSMVPLDEAMLDEAGMEGDAHRGAGSIRHLLIEDQEVLDRLELGPGQVKENLTLRGVDVNSLRFGTRLVIGDVVLELTKESNPCSRMEEIRPGLQEQLQGCRGIYAQVIAPGRVRRGDTVHVRAPEVAEA